MATTTKARTLQDRLDLLRERHGCPRPRSPSSEAKVSSRGLRDPQPRHRRRGDSRLALPDRLDHEGMDGDPRHAARRRGRDRPRRAGAPVSAELPGGRRPGVRSGDDSPPADAYERHRRRSLRRRRPRRRRASTVCGNLRGATAGASARRDDVVLQHRLHGARPRASRSSRTPSGTTSPHAPGSNRSSSPTP